MRDDGVSICRVGERKGPVSLHRKSDPLVRREVRPPRGRCGRTGVVTILAVALLVAAGGSAAGSASAGLLSSVARGAGSGDAFCQTMAAMNKDVPASSSPAAYRSVTAKLKSIEAKMLSVSPIPIKEDMKQVVTFINLLLGALAKVNYNSAKVPPAIGLKLINANAAVTPALYAVNAYAKKACGITLKPIPIS
jgi:hypothetical protein